MVIYAGFARLKTGQMTKKNGARCGDRLLPAPAPALQQEKGDI